MLIGYARVSTAEQTLVMQVDALKTAGVDEQHIYQDVGVSGAKMSRPGLDACRKALRDGDQLVVFRLDRLGRRAGETLLLLDDLQQKGVTFRSLTEGFDTSSPSGRAMLGVMSVFAAMEREVISERVREGLAAARSRGRYGGRPRALTSKQERELVALVEASHRTPPGSAHVPLKSIAERYGISVSTLRRVVARHRKAQDEKGAAADGL